MVDSRRSPWIPFALSFFLLTLPLPARATRDAECNQRMLEQMQSTSARARVEDLVEIHRNKIRNGEIPAPQEIKMTFIGGPPGRDLYNAPGETVALYQGKPITLFIGREESPTSETDMRVAFYRKVSSGKYLYLNGQTGIPHLGLQDPFVNKIVTGNSQEFILGGVKVWPVDKDGHEKLLYATEFYRDLGKGVEHLKPFLTGPDLMKDIRLIQTKDYQRITVLTRPQSGDPETGGRGKVGMFHVKTLEEITSENIGNAPIFRHQLYDDQWGAVNAAEYLTDNLIGVIGHYAYFDSQNNRHYVGVSWIIHTDTGEVSDVEVILERSDLPGGLARGSKRPDLDDVIFIAGYRRNPNGTMDLMGGEGDKLPFYVRILDPFLKALKKYRYKHP